MLNSLHLYLRYLALSVRGQMQYRASFLMLTAGHFLLTGTEFLGVWALMERFGGLRGWRLPEVAVLYGAINVSFALAEGVGRGFDIFSQQVKSGDFDRLLLRPRSTAFQVAASEAQLFRVGRLAQGALILAWGLASAPIDWSPAAALLVPAMVLGGACLFYGLFVLQATLAFWTVDSLEVFNTVTYGGIETAQYPLEIYRPWFRRFFTVVVPLACANYLPVHALLGRPDPFGAPPLLQWAAPAGGLLFLLVCLRVWKTGERRYCSTGS
ncbi:MAG: ABC transporter permease [Armatimonadota bacterium]